MQVDEGLPLGVWIGVHTKRLGAALVLPLILTSCLFLGPLATMASMAFERTRNEVRVHRLSWANLAFRMPMFTHLYIRIIG